MGHQRPKVPQGSVHTQKTQANYQLHKGSFEIALQIPPPMKRTQGTKAVSAPTARKGSDATYRDQTASTSAAARGVFPTQQFPRADHFAVWRVVQNQNKRFRAESLT